MCGRGAIELESDRTRGGRGGNWWLVVAMRCVVHGGVSAPLVEAWVSGSLQ